MVLEHGDVNDTYNKHSQCNRVVDEEGKAAEEFKKKNNILLKKQLESVPINYL